MGEGDWGLGVGLIGRVVRIRMRSLRMRLSSWRISKMLFLRVAWIRGWMGFGGSLLWDRGN